jgi:hypothetical protein
LVESRSDSNVGRLAFLHAAVAFRPRIQDHPAVIGTLKAASQKSAGRGAKVMEKKRIRIAGAVAAVLLVLADANVALAVPIAPLSQPDATSPTLARMGGGGFHGGYHGGHNVVVNQRTNVVAGRGGYHGGYHGGHNVVVNRNTNVVVGRGGHGYYGGWRRPYAWAPGGAIAAGAAIGFMSAATAAAFATSAAPSPGMCWYYTDPFQTSGFWDVCP